MMAPSTLRRRHRLTWGLRLIGLVLLVILIIRVDFAEVYHLMRQADLRLVALTVAAIVPLILVKTVRWQILLRAQDVRYALWPAFLAYFGSLFVGFLTPGRLGEFVKAFHVQKECNISLARAVSSVLADRLFDLCALLTVGMAAIFALPAIPGSAKAGVVAALVLLVIPAILFLYAPLFERVQRWVTDPHHSSTWRANYSGGIGHLLFGPRGWLTEIHLSLRRLTRSNLLISSLLTVVAYALFFVQCYLLALALGLSAGFAPVTLAIALGSLITLVPISISGLGTRDAVLIAYLGTAGVSAEAALSFSLLVFFAFYLGGGLLGLLAWWLKPAPWSELRAEQQAAHAG